MNVKKNDEIADVLCVFPERIVRLLHNVPDWSQISEIRLRRGGALCVTGKNGTCFLREAGYSQIADENAYIVTSRDISEVLEKSCGYSVYAHEAELREGFITYGSGHRIGISGEVFGRDGSVSSVSSLCIRIAREHGEAANTLLGTLYSDTLRGVLIAGAPGTGKTTMLRAAAKAVSRGVTGKRYRTAIIDERYELAGRNGDAYSLGKYADIISGCTKAEGILRAVRLLSPELIVCDEISGEDEANSMLNGLCSGVKFLASMHASSLEELRSKSCFNVLCQAGVFDFAAVLHSGGSPGRIRDIHDLRGKGDEVFCGGTDRYGSVRLGVV